jgi:hypothetical protein
MGLLERLHVGKEGERRWALLKGEKRIWNAIESDMLGEAEVQKLTDFVHGRIDRIEWFGRVVDASQ